MALTVTAETNLSFAYTDGEELDDIFTVTGGTPSQYQIWLDSPADGEVTGVAGAIPVGQTVTETSLSNLVFVGGPSPGSDVLWVRAYDGQWSNWVESKITDQGATPPTVTAFTGEVNASQVVPFSLLFTVTGGTQTEYQVWLDSPADGEVTDNGVPIAVGQAVTVTSLTDLDFIGSTTPGSDVLWLRAYDGQWSSWTKSTLTDQGIPPPTVTGFTGTVDFNEVVPFSLLFTVTGGTPTLYQVWLDSPADGELTDNGTPIVTVGQAVNVTSLTGLDFVGGQDTGTDGLWLRAYDGQWSSWTESILTDQGVAAATDASSASAVTNVSELLAYTDETNSTFLDTSSVYNDTVVGFSEASGDRIHLVTDTVSDALAHSTQVNGGADTLITLSDSSTILLKGVTQIDTSFFA